MSNNQHLWIYLICTQPMWQHTVYHRYLTQTLQTPWCRASNSWMFSSAGGAIGVATCGSSEVIRWINGWLDESIQWPLKASRNWCFWALNLKFWKMWISRCYSTQIYWDEDCILVWLPSFSGGNLLLDLAHHTSTFGNRSAESPPHVSTTPLIYWKMVSTFESFQLHRELSKRSISMGK